MELTSSQQKAAKELIEFLLGTKEELVICAAAGCGKTYLVSWFLKEGYKEYLQECNKRGLVCSYTLPPVVTATTNKAAEVLRDKLGYPVPTIHSFLRLKVEEDYSEGITKIVKKDNYKIRTNGIVFIDECSMISSELYTYIKNTLINCKIIYVGDKDQLDPVRAYISPIFIDESIPKIELTENIRLKNHPEFLELAEQLKNTVITKKFYPIKPIKELIEYVNQDELKRVIDTNFAIPNKDSKILTYTNKKALLYNDYIKQDLRQANYPFLVGEWYIVNSPLFDENDKIIFVTDKEIKITDIEEELTLNFLDKSLNIVKLWSYDEYFYAPLYTEEYLGLLKELAKRKEWKRFFFLKKHIADLRLADSCTIHKAQGSTYKNVIVDLGDLGKCTSYNTAARLLYVACTRATDHIYLTGSLPKRLGGMP